MMNQFKRLPFLHSKITHQQFKKISVQDQKLNSSLLESDPDLYTIIQQEKNRIKTGINLIASENYQSTAVKEALGSCLSSKYSEGYPGARYYGGNKYIDMVESLCQKRALEAFRLDPAEWGVNVQPLSGAPANLMVYSALINPHDRIMGLNLTEGGHLSHGYQTDTKKISTTSIFFESLPYQLNKATGMIDYEDLAELSMRYKPKILIAGASAYSRDYDYPRMREIANNCGAILLSDMAHISGLVAADLVANPFNYSDVVTTTTHKTLRGPRGAMIFYRKGVKKMDKQNKPIMYDLQQKIDFSVFPGFQGGPHNHTISALCTALKQAQTPQFVEYQKQVLKNSQQLAQSLLKNNFELVSGGTDNHLLLVDLRPKQIDGARLELLLEYLNIYVNKNTVPGDKSALVPKGLRLGSPAMTSRGLVEEDFKEIGEFLNKATDLAIQIQAEVNGKKLSDYKKFLLDNHANMDKITQFKQDVTEFSQKFDFVD